MRAPRFWDREGLGCGGLLPLLLQPAAALFAAGGSLRQRRVRPYRSSVPVLCIGNLVVGGAGKTPVALAVAAALQAGGRQPHFLTRGYGGSLAGPIRVAATHDFRAVGDEAVLLAERAPTWVARDRAAGARAAEQGGCDILVMDDGFQNPGLAKTLSLLVVDARYGFGNGRVIPAGPLRERLATGLARADALILVGDGMPGIETDLPTARGRLVPEGKAFAGRRVVAFAGIGRPEKFYDSLGAAGADIVATRSFADHHPFTAAELDAIGRLAREHQAIPVTTEKDRVRIGPDAPADLATLPIRFVFDDPEAMSRLLGMLPAK